MTKFVKVMKNSEEHNITNVEIIRADCLVKVYKENGNIGTGICFEWFCESRNEYLSWSYDCGYESERNRMFEQYEKSLTGTVIEERASEYEEVDHETN